MPPKPFKPPRPSGSGTNNDSSKPRGRPRKSDTSPSTTKISKPKTKSKPSKRISARDIGLPSLSPDSDAPPQSAEETDDPFASQPKQKTKRRVEVEDEEEERKEGIPSDLLTVLLHEFFKEKTRMSKGASKAVGKYMDTFVRETVARCSYAGKERGQEGILEVEDLEKMAPQMLLDF